MKILTRNRRFAHSQTDDRHSAAELLLVSLPSIESFLADNRYERHSRLSDGRPYRDSNASYEVRPSKEFRNSLFLSQVLTMDTNKHP